MVDHPWGVIAPAVQAWNQTSRYTGRHQPSPRKVVDEEWLERGVLDVRYDVVHPQYPVCAVMLVFPATQQYLVLGQPWLNLSSWPILYSRLGLEHDLQASGGGQSCLYTLFDCHVEQVMDIAMGCCGETTSPFAGSVLVNKLNTMLAMAGKRF